ncbi:MULTISPECIES: NUDIX hydrolase [Deefgea]|uniref:NUDIX hydrolase n=1 Tax=Deefgea TaxID=400947 RepID=UPI00194528CB|nr:MULTISPECIES: DUF4743 domain-containing protein [Deefgea]MBM9888045.1 DUF4743 domain-containing protein [Deefgea sp. CFH1-16]
MLILVFSANQNLTGRIVAHPTQLQTSINMKKTSVQTPIDFYTQLQIEGYLASQPRFTPEGLSPFLINARQYGWLERETIQALQQFSDLWHFSNGQVELRDKHPAEQLQAAAQYLHQQGFILGWRNENYGVYSEDAREESDFKHALCALERASFRRFGFLSRAVHINAYYPDGTLCLGVRANNKSIDPNKLDNMAAGGIPLGESIYDCAIRELAEEAGAPLQIAKFIQFAEIIHTRRNESDGTHNEILYCYDLALPDDFVPHNQDGEVAEFHRLRPSEVIKQLNSMTWDAGAVTSSFILRNGSAAATLKN